MTTQPDALRLADALETAEISYTSMVKAAAELRRLHAEVDLQQCSLNVSRQMIEGYVDWIRKDEALLRQALAVIDSMEQNHGNLWQVPYEPEQLDAIATALRERLK